MFYVKKETVEFKDFHYFSSHRNGNTLRGKILHRIFIVSGLQNLGIY